MGMAWISGIEGRAIVTDTSAGEVAHYLLAAGSSTPLRCSLDVHHLLRGSDIETIEDPGTSPYPAIYEKLDRAWREERALMLALVAVDAGKPAELRAEAVDLAEELLAATSTREAVRNRFLSDPLPETADASALPDGSVVAELLCEAREARPQVQVARAAWQRTAYQFPTEAATLEMACMKHGGFAALAAALNAQDPSHFESWYRSVTGIPMFAQPGAEMVLDAWREQAFELARNGSPDPTTAAMSVGPSEGAVAPEAAADDEIGRLYDLIAELAAEGDAKDPELDQQLDDAWTRLRQLQAEEADRFYAAFEASLKMPIDAGKHLSAEADALRRKLENLTSTDPSADKAVRS